MSNPQDSFLTGSNIDFIEAQYQRFLDDPKSVDATWADAFRAIAPSGRPLIIDGLKLDTPKRRGPADAFVQNAAGVVAAESMGLQGKVDQTVFAFRLRGHLLAQLDPLGVPRPTLKHVADLGMVSEQHFTPAELDALVDSQFVFDEPRVPLRRVLDRLRKTYTQHIGVEFMQLLDSERRRWLQLRMERSENRTGFEAQDRLRLLTSLSRAEAFETTIHTKQQAAKRFSVEGGESLIPMLDELIEAGAELGIREVVFGMAHRGRLNMLANVLGKPAAEIFSEFAGPADPTAYLNRGDVKYHMGYSSDRVTRSGAKVHLTLAFNPSHLGVVHPVVEGRVRAKQDRVGEGGKHAILPLVVHGDAAFAGQGLVAETLNLSGLAGYDTGGTIHIVVNNQLGYTTEADQGRTSIYCTAIAQMLDIPVFHVNGDDPEACIHVLRMATEYRQRFHTDVVIDLVCFRKYGHNEGDVPDFTQPKMYELIRAHQTVRQLYAAQLVKDGQLTAEQAAQVHADSEKLFSDAFAKARTDKLVKDPSANLGIWAKHRGGADADSPQVTTGLPLETLKPLLAQLAAVPDGFTLHPNVMRVVIEKRVKMVEGTENLDWGAAEMLAYATLATSGTVVRLTGQDTERGTFAHRHAVLHDMKTGRTAFPLGKLKAGQARAEVINSPLSEMACMGFEFGYSLDYPDALVAWEAQFGDFANNAQVMIDQFIVAAEDKWRRLTGLTLLLPHGYEGGGPEHSTARPERFLELAAEDNLQLCYPSTAAQFFHLLRRQAMRSIRKPLVVMLPKSLLRLPEAASPWSAFTQGTYQRVLGETNPAVAAASARKLILCSGKVYFDLLAAREKAKLTDITIARLEQTYPLPTPELQALLKAHSSIKEVTWVQEEPKNGGSWRFLHEPLAALVGEHPKKPTLTYVGRPESASPATGYMNAHTYEQNLLVDQALAKGS
ncbi:MAG: 2-oxoglutarate dehydrogenase E1 component [Myxococcaceae bacterium]|nr:2-oxoglutarate dehydrogenase E1 component [Myxococcaceae bacterium]